MAHPTPPSQTSDHMAQCHHGTLRDWEMNVVENRLVGHNLWILTLEHPEPLTPIAPGQFVMVDLNTEGFSFRRPFSVYSQPHPHQLSLYYKVVGAGTRRMAQWTHKSPSVRILSPLGKGFTRPSDMNRALLIGGGIGIAPMAFMGESFAKASEMPLCVYGTRTLEELAIIPRLESLFPGERLAICTDDGSYGFGGNVVQCIDALPLGSLSGFERAYVCGPNPMMAAVVDYLTTHAPHIVVEVSLETPMPCGTGACFGCVVARADQDLPSRTCIEGPVFPARALQWSPKGPLGPGQNQTQSLQPKGGCS